ncbi:uncharacterized protein LOC128296451 [Gossypium arboreum]|uniref:uncharacterized protein LOC128296451 n=1 Tax=Gossypium arboreum TaxID=29729 RepID=UPI0022F14942|nr:uncharacterized protein LOC128296451 [Gossypium arboreum]
MEESIIQTTEKNAVVRDWSLRTQKEKGASLMEGCIPNLPEHVTVNVRQNNLDDLTQIWRQWDSDTRDIFTKRYGDIASMIAVYIDERLIQAMIKFWDPAYQCFIFNQEDMTLIMEEYAALLRIDNVQFYKIYMKEPKPMTFKKKLVKLTGLTDIWAEKQIKKKNEISCIPWFSLRDLVLNHPDILKRVNLFTLAIYGLVVFPKVLGHIEVAVVDFFEKLKQGINPIPTILAETFRSLSSCKRKGCNLESTVIRPSVLLYKVGNQDWVPLLGLWEGVGYALLLAQRQFSSRQFIPATGGLAQSEFAFASEGYTKRVRDTAKSWKKIHLMELALYADTFTQDYDVWRKQRMNSQQVSSTNYTFQNPFLEEMPSELEMARLEFEREKAKMSRDLSALQEENYQLKIDVQIERSRAEKVQKEAEIKGKTKKEEGKAARAMLELRKKNAEYETVSTELIASRSECRELREKIRELEETLQARQQQLDILLEALQEKNSQYDRDTRAYGRTLYEKDEKLSF